MAKKKQKVEEVVTEVTTEVIDEVTPEKTEKEVVEEEVDLSKFKSKDNPNVIKVDLSKPPKNTKEEDGVSEELDKDISTGPISEVGEEVQVQDTELTGEEEVSVIQEVTNEEVTTEEVVEDIKEELQENPQLDLPENVEKLVEFMKDTGGTVEDYVRLNADYSGADNVTLLREYYKQTKPHLDPDEINFLMEDNFAYDEDMDEERDVRKKKLAIKEEVAKAKNFLENLKTKYYDEIKLRPGVTQDQQKANDFFNRYNEEQEVAKKQHETFRNITKDYFAKDFKGFEFNLGEKKFRYNVNNPHDVAESQSSIVTFVKKFLNDDGSIKDHKGYHKAIYAARNADTIAQHFYEQGKADAIKDVSAKSKNISSKPRSTSPSDIYLGGLKVRAISGVDSSKLRIKTRKK
tara:strand:- start:683 stop:1894 length:1212 start_codon:yes stop_codon:yes gene_type:complete